MKDDNYTKRKFTPEQYREYIAREKWEADQTKAFDDYSDYEAYYISLVDRLLAQSRDHFKAVKKEWAYAIHRFESFSERLKELSSAKADPAMTQLPYLQKALMELVAILFDSLPRPQFTSRQSTEDDFVGALNYYSTEELDSNGFDMTMYYVGLDIQLCNLGVIKSTVDMDQTGPFGQPGRICIRRVEPRFVHPDPLGGSLDWDMMQYLIVAEPYDLSEIRTIWKDYGGLVQPETAYSITRADEDTGDQRGALDLQPHVIKAPGVNEGGPFTDRARGRALVKECWLHDATLEFVAETRTFSDDNGTPIEDGQKNESVWKVDKDGYVVGNWSPKYPNGRLIIVANGVILFDDENPYRHKMPPYVFFRGRPTTTILAPGDASYLILIERKLNDIYTRMFSMAQANIERPTIIDKNAFDSTRKWKILETSADSILPVTPGARVEKMMPGEIPQFVLPFAQFLRQFFDEFMGITGVMRGQLQEGSQLSAQALGDLQSQAGTRTRMKARFIEYGLKQLGEQLMWLIRETYPSGLTAKINDPSTGQTKIVKFDKDSAGDDYAVVIQAGSSLPGSKQSAFEQALTLLRERVVDPQYVLETAQVPGADKILQRTQQQQLEDISSQATGRALGLQIKQITKPDDKAGRKKMEGG